MSRWREFEKLAEQIYRELAPSAQVKWNDHIQGQDTGALRQIDVSIRWNYNEQRLLTVVQTKNWKRKADINDVGEFAAVVSDLRATGGILVCRSGFTNNARRYGKKIGIQLHNLHDATSTDWRLALTIPILWIERFPVVAIEGQARFEVGDTISRRSAGCVDLGDNRGEVEFAQYFGERWNTGELPMDLGVEHTFDCDAPVYYRAIDAGDQPVRRPVVGFQCRYGVEQRAWLGQFTPEKCRGFVDLLNDDAFVVTYLPVGEVPTVRGEEWLPIADPAKLALSLRGTIVTTQAYSVDTDSADTLIDNLRYLGP